MKIIDAKGELCPKPIILTKKAIKESKTGTEIKVIVDNKAAQKNINAFLIDQNLEFKNSANENEYFVEFILSKKSKSSPSAIPEDYCKIFTDKPIGDFIITIKSNKMGEGSEELGEILLKAYLNTIIELEILPSAILFYNSGVKVCTKNSGVIDSLVELKTMGVEIIVCGTCIDYYELKENISIGTVSNMYVIAEKMANASSIIFP